MAMVSACLEHDEKMLTPPRLFITDGVISLPIAIAGFFVLPDVPEISKVWYLSKTVSVSSVR